MTRFLLLTLALMCEHVNAAPQASESPSVYVSGAAQVQRASRPYGAAPFMLSNPMCQTGFMLKQRFDTRDSFGIIVKRKWVMTNCANGRIVYGRKV